MKDYRQLIRELPSKTIVLACAKFNPPTSGHELLIKAVKTVAEQRNASYAIYASDLSDAKKNPLLIEKKLQYLNLLFPNTNFMQYSDNIAEVVSTLKETYRNVIVVTSADKVASMKKSLKEATVVSAYEKDPDADDSTSPSRIRPRAFEGASRARLCARPCCLFARACGGRFCRPFVSRVASLSAHSRSRHARARFGANARATRA